MIIVCQSCQKKYRLDETKIKGKTASFKCRKCGDRIAVTKPEPEDDILEFEAIAAEPDAPWIDTGLVSEVEDQRQAAPPAPHKTPPETPSAAPPEKRKTGFGLFYKIILLMLVVSLVPFAGYWIISFNESSERVRSHTEKLMSRTAEGLSNQVDEWIDKNVRVLKAAARLPEIKTMDRLLQEPVLKAIQKEYPWMYLVFTVDRMGMNAARNDGKPLKDYSDRQYYKDVIKKGKNLTWQTLIGKTSKKPALVIAVPIKSQGRTVGVMACAANIEDISQKIARWKRGRTGFAFLVDENAKVVAHQIKQYVVSQKVLKTHPMVQAYNKDKQFKTMQFTAGGGKKVLGHVRGNRYGWALVLQQDTDEVYQPLKGVQRFSLIMLVATLVIVSLIAYLFARALVRPIMTLTDIAERMSLGELDVKIDIRSKDEIGLLARAIERMRTSLNLAMTRLRRRK
jgi:methyl-accepting chemotaxis protein